MDALLLEGGRVWASSDQSLLGSRLQCNADKALDGRVPGNDAGLRQPGNRQPVDSLLHVLKTCVMQNLERCILCPVHTPASDDGKLQVEFNALLQPANLPRRSCEPAWRQQKRSSHTGIRVHEGQGQCGFSSGSGTFLQKHVYLNCPALESHACGTRGQPAAPPPKKNYKLGQQVQLVTATSTKKCCRLFLHAPNTQACACECFLQLEHSVAPVTPKMPKTFRKPACPSSMHAVTTTKLLASMLGLRNQGSCSGSRSTRWYRHPQSAGFHGHMARRLGLTL